MTVLLLARLKKKQLYQNNAWNYHLMWAWGRPVSELGKHLLSAVTQDLVWTFESSCLSVTCRELFMHSDCMYVFNNLTNNYFKSLFFYVNILSMHLKIHNLVIMLISYCNFNFSLHKVLTYTVLESWINSMEEGNAHNVLRISVDVLSFEPTFLVKQKHNISAKVKWARLA